MRVTVEQGNIKGQVLTHVDGMIAFFPNGFSAVVGSAVEVMISGHNPKCTVLFVTPITDAYMLIDHKGFECSGSQCCTTSSSPQTEGILTPGKCGVYAADNVNCKFGLFGESRYIIYPKQPGKAWVLKSDVEASRISRKVSIKGLDSIQEMSFWVERNDPCYSIISDLRKEARG